MENGCIDCEFFTWWDGDYCCTKKLNILYHSADGEFDYGLVQALKENESCDSFRQYPDDKVNLYKEPFEEIKNQLNKNE